MRNPLLTSLICLTLTSPCSAATLTSRPLLGSAQSVVHSTFCTKYRCRALPVRQGGGFSIFLYGHIEEYRTRVDFKFDRYRQFMYAEFQLIEASRTDRGVTERESSMISDFYTAATGKVLPLGIRVSQGERYSEDVTRCIEQAKAQPGNRFIYSEAELPLTDTGARATASLECSTGSRSLKAGKYQPVISIGFSNNSDEFVNDKVYY